MAYNLRHLRIFLAVATHGSITRAAVQHHLSQPAVTQAIAKLERVTGTSLFQRTPRGLFVNDRGLLLQRRVERAFAHLDPALVAVAPRLRLTASASQLQALIAVRDTESFTLAAGRLKIAQPTVHRAVTQLVREATRPLFERISSGFVATRAGQSLADAARLAFAELAQAEMELAEAIGREVGRIVIGAMPLSRSYVLPKVIARFREQRPWLLIRVLEGPYADLLGGLRRGEIDLLIGALREPLPIEDVEQTLLFEDSLALVARPGHPLAGQPVALEGLASFPWVVSGPETPARAHFERLMASMGEGTPRSVVESSSLILMRELLVESDHLGCISRLQAEPEIKHGLLVRLDFPLPGTSRRIGITTRRGWEPTRAQSEFLTLLHRHAGVA
jgi:DNA-binding transcriptional LysR family regulator